MKEITVKVPLSICAVKTKRSWSDRIVSGEVVKKFEQYVFVSYCQYSRHMLMSEYFIAKIVGEVELVGIPYRGIGPGR